MAIALKQKTSQQIIWADDTLLDNCEAKHFEAQFWQQANAITGSAIGRGTTYFINLGERQAVLRHYRRGGLIGRLINDSYLYTGEQSTRAWQEMALLAKLDELQLPAPKPIAARVQRNGLFYRADILCEKIPDAQDVHQYLLEQSLPNEQWSKIGETIKQFHDAQVYHHDLNIHNIMLDKDHKIWLIDFDKCGFKQGQNWKSANLERLLRSLKKEQAKTNQYHFTEENWSSLLAGYYG